MTIGAITFPRSSPNLIQAKFKGVSNFELIKPKIRKIIEITNDHTLIVPPSIRGKNAINKKTKKKTIPKLLFELFFFI